MGYSTLKAALDAVVRANGDQQITGSNLNGVMTTLLQGVDIMDRSNPVDTSGMNKVVLKSSKTFAQQVNSANTIYEIRDDFDLGGASFSMPSNCILNFCGGAIRNGVVKYKMTYLAGNVRNYCTFDPTSSFSSNECLSNGVIFASWFGVSGNEASGDTIAFQRAVDHLNNNMITLVVDRFSILLTDTISIKPLINARPYKIIGQSKNNPTFFADASNFAGDVVFDIDNGQGSCVLEHLLLSVRNNGSKDLTGFKIAQTRNSTINQVEANNAAVGIHIVSMIYSMLTGCRFDSGKRGVVLDGSFNSLVFDGLHCGGNSEKGFESTATSSPTNIILNEPVFEANRVHAYFEKGAFVINDPYMADASEKVLVNVGASVRINGTGASAGLASAGSGVYKPTSASTEVATLTLSGGETILNNTMIMDNCNPKAYGVGNKMGIKHNGGTLIINGVRCSNMSASNMIIKSSVPELIRHDVIAENFVLDGHSFQREINYNIFSPKSNKVAITTQPGISFVSGGNGKIMRVTLPTTSGKCGFVMPLRFPSDLVGKYVIVRYTFQFGATESNQEMTSNGHKVINDSAIHTNSWVQAEQQKAVVEPFGLLLFSASAAAWYGYTYPFLNNLEGTAVGDVCTDADQMTTREFPFMVHGTEDYLVFIFNPNQALSLTEEMVIDFHEIIAMRSEFAGRIVGVRDTNERFILPSNMRPSFGNSDNAKGMEIWDSTLGHPVVYNGSAWVNMDGSSMA